jgi:hypothetical protein
MYYPVRIFGYQKPWADRTFLLGLLALFVSVAVVAIVI